MEICGKRLHVLRRATLLPGELPAIVCEDDDSNCYCILESEMPRASGQNAELVSQDLPPITRMSSAGEKLALFKTLFRGRREAFARGFTKRDGSIGYTPVCANKWKLHLCNMKKVPCRQCPNRSFSPLTDQHLIDHMRGKTNSNEDVIGIYPLDKDCKVWFLAADFDEKNWQQAVQAYCTACAETGVPYAVERSRSGNGAHVWTFFNELIQAEKARMLGLSLISRAISNCPVMDFSSYDRLFPTQSTINEDGLGNLIALPFQAAAMRQENSMFVDENFRPYEDQWRFLSGIRRISKSDVERVLKEIKDPLTVEPREKDPEHTVTVHHMRLDKGTLPERIAVRFDHGLTVNTMGLSSKAVTAIKRCATFSNPEFFKKQRMRQSVFGCPRMISLARGDCDAVWLPRGAKPKLMELLEEDNVVPDFEEARVTGPRIHVRFKGELRELQQQALDNMLQHESGILEAPTGFGKTVVAAAIIASLQVKTLILVPRSTLLEQWASSLERFLDIDDVPPVRLTKSGRKSKNQPGRVGVIGGGKELPSGIVDVATYQSLFEKDKRDGSKRVKDLVGEYALVICDECHHSAAVGLQNVLATTRAKHLYGLSATPKRYDRLDAVVRMMIGPVVHRVDVSRHAHEQAFERILVPHFTAFRLKDNSVNYTKALSEVSSHDERNRLIAEDVAELLEEGRKPLVLTKRKSHGAALADLLRKEGFSTYVLNGDGSAKERQARLDEVRGLSDDARYCLIATGAYIGEGFDDSRLDTLVLAAPVSFEGVVAQYVGRLHREREGKQAVYVHDYADLAIPVFERSYRKRLKAYSKLCYRVGEEIDESGRAAAVMTRETYAKALEDDIAAARSSVVICSERVNKDRVRLLEAPLLAARRHGIPVQLVLQVGNDAEAGCAEAVARLEKLGASVRYVNGSCMNFVVIDGRQIWYGSIPPLSFASGDDIALRFCNAELAHGLTEMNLKAGDTRM